MLPSVFGVSVCAHLCLWYLCFLALLKESQGDISLNRAHKGPGTSLCAFLFVGRWVFVRQKVIRKVTAGWVCLLFSVHFHPIKRQDWQICSSSFSSSLTLPCVLLSFLSSLPLCPFFSFFSCYPLPFTILGWSWLSYLKWPSSDVNITVAAKSKTQRTFLNSSFPAETHSLSLMVFSQKGVYFSSHGWFCVKKFIKVKVH